MDVVGRIHGRLVFNRRTRVLAKLVGDAVPQGVSVLDVGCGDGLVAKRILEDRPDLDISGVDVLLRPITHISVKLFDGVTIPLPDASIPYVMLVDVLHHTTDPAALLGECSRVAGKGIIIKDHLCQNVMDHQLLRLMDWVGNKSHGVALTNNYMSRRQWDHLFLTLELSRETWLEDLKLYPRPLSSIFGRSLHFVSRLQKN